MSRRGGAVFVGVTVIYYTVAPVSTPFLKIVEKFFLIIYVWPNCIYRIYTVVERLQVDISADTGGGVKRRRDSTDGGDGGGI